ncbi:MAG: alpha/beta hydrolase [Desulfofustis sp.]|nr:alpha/beta hydrolase [Desulfofustis sp.]
MKTLLLPGLGADATMYPSRDYANLYRLTIAEWPVYNGEETLAAVARRVIDEHGIGREMVVGGASLGGMVALEIAKIAGNGTVILIGSATSPSEVNPVLQKLSHLADYTPIRMFQALAGKINEHHGSDLLAMFERADSRFVTAMCRAIFDWEGRAAYRGTVCRIHGQKDKVILPPKDDGELITDGGHLISMTHAPLVAAFVERCRAAASEASGCGPCPVDVS